MKAIWLSVGGHRFYFQFDMTKTTNTQFMETVMEVLAYHGLLNLVSYHEVVAMWFQAII